MQSKTHDMRRRIYRRIYSAALTDKRINQLTELAELCLSRLHLVADDYGNLPGDVALLLPLLYPRRREVTADQLDERLGELLAGGFIERYEAEGDDWIHIHGWQDAQPAGKNGRRVQKYPMRPDGADGEAEGSHDNPGESEIIQDQPKKSGASRAEQYQNQDQYHAQAQPHNQDQGAAVAAVDGGLRPKDGESRRWPVSKIERQDLTDNRRLAGIHEQLKQAGYVNGCARDRLFVFSMAEHALNKGDNPPAMFRRMIERNRRDTITEDAEQRAAQRIKEHYEGIKPRKPAYDPTA